MSTLKISIQFCGGWGYASHYIRVRNILKLYFPKLEIIGIEDDDTTGNFEIYDNQKNVLHSKSKNRQGRCETVAEQELLVSKIANLMNIPIPEVDEKKLQQLRDPQGIFHWLLTYLLIHSLTHLFV